MSPLPNMRLMRFTVMRVTKHGNLGLYADLVFAFLTIYYLYAYVHSLLLWQGRTALGLGTLSATLLVAVLVHSLKALRLYLILLDYALPLPAFLKLYGDTALVNLLLPYKGGELYRGLRVGRSTGSLVQGYVSVLFDRFLDTLALVTVVIGFSFFTGGRLPLICAAFVIFAFSVVALYWLFPSLHQFWRHYLLFSKSSEKALQALRLCQLCHKAYQGVHKVVQGRFVLLYLVSMAAWLTEVGGLLALGGGLQGADLGRYLTAILWGQPIGENYAYVLLCFILLALLAAGSRSAKGGRNG